MKHSTSYDFGPLSSYHVQAGDRITVSHGVAWLTMHGEDVLLRAGTSYQAEEAGHLLVEPMSACRYQLHRHNPAAVLAAPLVGALRALWAWYQGRKQAAGLLHHAR